MEKEIAILWDHLQFRQELHDRLFHTDIYNLSKPRRLAHLVLHHCKYMAKIYTIHSRDKLYREKGTASFERDIEGRGIVNALAVDGVIICLSMLNVCNKRMSDLGGVAVWELDSSIDILIHNVGMMAKVVEDVDHMAQTTPITEMIDRTKDMMTSYINIALSTSDDSFAIRDLFLAVQRRLESVESKHIFCEQLQTEMLAVMSNSAEQFQLG